MVDLCNLHEVAGDLLPILQIAKLHVSMMECELLAEFVARYNRENKRCFQSAKASGKLVCPHCNENGRLTFLGEKGMLQHYRRMHRQRFDVNLCKHLFKVKHYEETVEMLKQLSLYRKDSERDLKDFQVKAKSCGDLLLAGKTKREAVKLAALAFKHRGNVKHLGSEPLLIEVIEKFNLDDHPERFHAWYLDSGEIHVESVFVRKALPSAPGAINFPLQEFVHTAEIELSGRSAEDVTALSVLQQTFGYERFRPGQEEGVNALLQGKDCIILIPTGGGKTIIYSIPTLMMNGISVVISPLLMLMHDQVLRLREKAINTTYINSLMTATEREQVIGNLARPDSEYKVLICGPEIILSDDIFKLLASLRKAGRLSFIAVDEAHVIDTWGCDFRHHYQELISLRQLNVPVVALTGTATESTVSVMKQVLGMDSPLIVRVPFQRDNLHFEVIEKESGKASSTQQIIDLINERFMNMCGIVYCQTREECETLALELKNNNHRAIYYHGGIIDPEIKVKHTNDWLEGKFEIMASTNAFGMGIDKSDVRFVIHKSMPNSLEAMVQESGRAGRDNEIAHCVMFGRFDDRNFHLRNISKLDSEHTRQKRLASLNVISEYLLSKDTCRQRKICSHFDSSIEYDCGHCDNCTNETVLTEKDYTEIAQVTVKCLQHVIIFKDKPTTEELCNTLMGSKAAIILRNNLHQVPEYGYCKGKVKSKRLMEFLQYMIVKGFLKENLRSVDDRVRSVYISVGEVRDLLAGSTKVLYCK